MKKWSKHINRMNSERPVNIIKNTRKPVGRATKRWVDKLTVNNKNRCGLRDKPRTTFPPST